MRIKYRQMLLIAAGFLVSAGSVLYLTLGNVGAGSEGQAVDLALVDEMLRSSDQASTYRLIPESVMTGLCWQTGNGNKEGIFKDVNAGLAHWRDHAPAAVDEAVKDSGNSVVSVDEEYTASSLLSRQLDHLSFEATAYRFTDKSAELTGELQIGGHRRKIALMMNMPDRPAQHLIELTAIAVLSADDRQKRLSETIDEALNLCITMQAVKDTVLSDSSTDKPLMLSHYY